MSARVRILRWSDGIVRTAKEENVSVIPALEGVERLRTLIVAATPNGNHDVLDGKEDLVAAAYAYIACHESGTYAGELARRSIRGNDRLSSTVTLSSIKGRHQKQQLRQSQSTSPPHTQPSSPSRILPHEEDFIREGVISETVVTNLVLTATLSNERVMEARMLLATAETELQLHRRHQSELIVTEPAAQEIPRAITVETEKTKASKNSRLSRK